MKKTIIAGLVSALFAGSHASAIAIPLNTDTVYFNQKALPSDTQGSLSGSVSLAQSVIMPTTHGIEGDRQPHPVALRKTLVVFEPSEQDDLQNKDAQVIVKDEHGVIVYSTELRSPAQQPKPAGQIKTDVQIVEPDTYAHRIAWQSSISAIAGDQGKEKLQALLLEHKTIEVATSNGNFAYDFMLPESKELDGTIITFSSSAGYNSTIHYTYGSDRLSNGNRITYKNVEGSWISQSDIDYGKLSYSDKAYTAILPAEVVKPGMSLVFKSDDKEGILDNIKVGANTTLVINTVDVGLLTEPRGEFRFMSDKGLHRDYFQSLQISKLIVNPYEPIHLKEIMLPDGRLLTDVDPSKADGYGSDSHYRISRELISAGINSANYGVNSADVMNGSVWNISAPYHAAQVTVNNSIGNYTSGLITHGMLGSYAGVASTVSSTGNEFSHEVGHEFGAGTHAEAHYLGGFVGSVHNSSTNVNSTWGWDLFNNVFLPNVSKAKTNGSSCYEGQCAEPFAGHSFGWGTMAGGWPMHPSGNEYTLHTPYELNVFQHFMEGKANFDPESPTGFSKWDADTQTMQPWSNRLTDDLGLSITTVSGNNELNEFGADSHKFHELFATYNAVRLRTGNGHWARDFYLPEDSAFEGKIAVFQSSAGYNSHIHFGEQSITLINGKKHAFEFKDGQWIETENDVLDRIVDRVPAKQGVPVTTIVGYYDPSKQLPSYIYPALHGAHGAVYEDNFTSSSCQLNVHTREQGIQTYNLHNRQFKSGLMNRFHVNVETALQPYLAQVYCGETLLVEKNLAKPTLELQASIVTTELGAAPTLNGVGNITIKQGEQFNALDGVSAFDQEDGDISAKVTVTGEVNSQIAGTYELVYSVTDSEGQTVSHTRTITVEANETCLVNWQEGAVYVGGDKVVHNQTVWLAGWWTQGEEPGTTGEWGVWKATSESACSIPTTPEVTPPPPPSGEHPAYQAGYNYQPGDTVTGLDGAIYQCKPWPNSGWCSNGSYAPGASEYWQDAWNKL